MPRLSIFLLSTLACGDNVGAEWLVLDRSEAAGVTFEDVSVVGDVAFAVGARDAARGAVLVIDGDTWTAIDSPDLPPLVGVHAAAEDDVWAVASYVEDVPDSLLWHWDGATWTHVDLPSGATYVQDVWGTAPDDVLATANDASQTAVLLRWDGTTWIEDGAARAVYPPDGKEYAVDLTVGCSESRDDVWVASAVLPFLDGFAGTIHFDGSQWENRSWLPSDQSSGINDIACGAGGPWSIGSNDLFEEDAIARWDRTEWVLVPLLDPVGYPYQAAISAAGDDVWIAGHDRLEGEDSVAAQIWRLTEKGFVATVSEEIRFDTRFYLPVLRAIGQLASGRVLAFGMNGLVLDRPAR